MTEEKLRKKWFDRKKRPNDYDPFSLFNLKDENEKAPDIAMIMSGRNRAKSFRISSEALMDAWYRKRQFGYCRRFKQEMTANKVQQYFEDKRDFIKDMTDGEYNCVICYQGMLYFGGNQESGGIKKSEPIGYVFGVNISQEYKSLQYPNVYTLIYEEVFTIEKYAIDEPTKLFSIISTVQRSKEGFKCYLISNTVSRVNPYSLAWALTGLSKQKQGTIDRYKLMLPELDQEGKQRYLFIALEYLADAQGEQDFKASIFNKKEANTIGASIVSNDWDINQLYPVIHQKYIKDIDVKGTVIFEHDLFSFKADILQVPVNIYEEVQRVEEDDGDVFFSEETFPIIYISRKTTKVLPDTRVYSDRVHLSPNITKGYRAVWDIDVEVAELLDRGWVSYTDQLTANEFNQCLEYLY